MSLPEMMLSVPSRIPRAPTPVGASRQNVEARVQTQVGLIRHGGAEISKRFHLDPNPPQWATPDSLRGRTRTVFRIVLAAPRVSLGSCRCARRGVRSPDERRDGSGATSAQAAGSDTGTDSPGSVAPKSRRVDCAVPWHARSRACEPLLRSIERTCPVSAIQYRQFRYR
jgi:hypothetical protein